MKISTEVVESVNGAIHNTIQELLLNMVWLGICVSNSVLTLWRLSPGCLRLGPTQPHTEAAHLLDRSNGTLSSLRS